MLKPAEFKHVLGRGKRTRCTFFTATAARSSGPHARLGLTVAKKAIPKAVGRNRFKRVCREVFRSTHPLPVADIVIMASPKARELDALGMAAELRTYFEELRHRWPPS